MLTQERKQKLLNTFIERVNGKGQAMGDNNVCQYVKDNHPGCAIGCQPEFEPFKDVVQRYDGVPGIGYILNAEFEHLGENLCTAFNVTLDSDRDFLSELQILHDTQPNWGGTKNLYLRESPVLHFCQYWKLTVPESYYIPTEKRIGAK